MTKAGSFLLFNRSQRFRALHVPGEKRLRLQSFEVHLRQQVVELHRLGGLREGCERNDFGSEGKSPSTKL